MDMEFTRVRGPKKKNHGRGWGEYREAPGIENPVGKLVSMNR